MISDLLIGKADTSGLIQPGERIGYITASSTEAELLRVYGSAQVKSDSIAMGEGEFVPGTVLFPADSTQTLYIIWKDNHHKSHPEQVIIRQKGTIWHTKEGISIGTSLKQIENLNKSSVHIMGLGWDYSGTILSGKSGKLKCLGRFAADTDELVDRTLLLRLDSPFDYSDLVSEQEYLTVVGDNIYSSDNPVFQKLNPLVYEMVIFFPEHR
jgi:hypothetical protein